MYQKRKLIGCLEPDLKSKADEKSAFYFSAKNELLKTKKYVVVVNNGNYKFKLLKTIVLTLIVVKNEYLELKFFN